LEQIGEWLWRLPVRRQAALVQLLLCRHHPIRLITSAGRRQPAREAENWERISRLVARYLRTWAVMGGWVVAGISGQRLGLPHSRRHGAASDDDRPCPRHGCRRDGQHAIQPRIAMQEGY
jgi:hypothetical protein